MKGIGIRLLGVPAVFVLCCGMCLAQAADGEKAAEAPGWEALADKAEDLAAAQYGTDDLSAQIDAKEAYLQKLLAQRSALRKQQEVVATESHKAVQEIDRIEDRQLRDESLLRFKSSKDVRAHTLNVTLAAVEGSIGREERELDTLRRHLTAREAAARLYGLKVAQGVTYATYLSAEAKRVRQGEETAYQEFRKRRLAALRTVIMAGLSPMVPSLAEEVMRPGAE